MAKKRQNHPQHSTFHSVRGSDSCYISNQPLYFHKITLNKVFSAQEGAPTAQSGSSTTNAAWIGKKNAQPKSPPKTAHSALSGDRSDSCYTDNQTLYFHLMTLSKGIRAREGFLHHKVALRPRMPPELAKKYRAKITPKIHSTFLSVRGSDSCYISNQPPYFHKRPK